MSDAGSSRAARHPLAPCLELFVYAPIGLLVTARRHLPSLVEAGRHQAHTQVRVARMVGEFAIKLGQREVAKRLVPPDARTAASPAPPRPVEVAEVVALPARHTAPTSQTGAAAGDLAIPSYDSLAASQVVARLASLTPAELASVRRYEAAHRNRRTILHRIDQLGD